MRVMIFVLRVTSTWIVSAPKHPVLLSQLTAGNHVHMEQMTHNNIHAKNVCIFSVYHLLNPLICWADESVFAFLTKGPYLHGFFGYKNIEFIRSRGECWHKIKTQYRCFSSLLCYSFIDIYRRDMLCYNTCSACPQQSYGENEMQ